MTVRESHPLHPGEGSPVFISAGIIKTPEDAEQFLAIDDPALTPLLTFGSFTWDEFAGNKGTSSKNDAQWIPGIGAYGNARGLPNGGRAAIERLRPTIARFNEVGLRSIISITNLPTEKGVDVIPKLASVAADIGVTGIEINMSCPNGVKPDGSLHAPICNDPNESKRVMKAVDAEIGGSDVLIGVKDGPHTTGPHKSVDGIGVGQFVRAVNEYTDFITGINTIGGQPFPEITVTNGVGGMSGPIVTSVAHQWLHYAHQYAPRDKAILSTGGIESTSVVTEFARRRALGALLVGGAQQFYRSSSPARLAVEWGSRILAEAA